MKPLLALLAFAIPLSSAPLPKPRGTPNYYPVALGNEWLYEVKFGNGVRQSLRVKVTELTVENGVATATQNHDSNGEVSWNDAVQIDGGSVFKTMSNDSPYSTPLRLIPA